MGISKIVAAGAAAMILGAAPPASATTFTATYSGVVIPGTLSGPNGPIVSGIDNLGLFSAAGTNLVGKTYSASYLFNDYGPGISRSENPGTWSRADGNYAPTFVKLTFTLDGTTRTIGTYGGSVFQGYLPTNGYSQVFHSASDHKLLPNLSDYEDINVNNSIGSSVNSITSNYRYDTPLNYTAKSGDQGFGDLNVLQNGPSGINYLEYLLLRPSTVTIALVSTAAPEPDQWLLLLCGVGAVGAALRQKRNGAPFGRRRQLGHSIQ